MSTEAVRFDLREAMEVLERTPQTLTALLSGLSGGWLGSREGEQTWSPPEIVLHLIEAERTNWIPRIEFVLREGDRGPFPAFDRFAHLNGPKVPELDEALREFQTIRNVNLTKLTALVPSPEHLDRAGLHPQLGRVTVRELISAWTVHDLTHLAQIVRVMGKRYRDEVGPFRAFLSVLKE